MVNIVQRENVMLTVPMTSKLVARNKLRASTSNAQQGGLRITMHTVQEELVRLKSPNVARSKVRAKNFSAPPQNLSFNGEDTVDMKVALLKTKMFAVRPKLFAAHSVVNPITLTILQGFVQDHLVQKKMTRLAVRPSLHARKLSNVHTILFSKRVNIARGNCATLLSTPAHAVRHEVHVNLHRLNAMTRRFSKRMTQMRSVREPFATSSLTWTRAVRLKVYAKRTCLVQQCIFQNPRLFVQGHNVTTTTCALVVRPGLHAKLLSARTLKYQSWVGFVRVLDVLPKMIKKLAARSKQSAAP